MLKELLKSDNICQSYNKRYSFTCTMQQHKLGDVVNSIPCLHVDTWQSQQ